MFTSKYGKAVVRESDTSISSGMEISMDSTNWLVDKNKICFILCVNNKIYQKECSAYINELYIPEDFKVEILTIEDASSMTEGYHSAMLATDAKYKVYLHQDVFIVNNHFIVDLVNIFRSNARIGIIGMVGAYCLPETGVMWETKRCGKLYSSNYITSSLHEFSDIDHVYEEVEAVDGLLMATQYDIRWRKELFMGWDFYDISQCLEFRKQGYQVVVPRQEKPWCFHDNSVIKSNHYDKWNEIFLKEYKNDMILYQKMGKSFD